MTPTLEDLVVRRVMFGDDVLVLAAKWDRGEERLVWRAKVKSGSRVVLRASGWHSSPEIAVRALERSR